MCVCACVSVWAKVGGCGEFVSETSFTVLVCFHYNKQLLGTCVLPW
jgi:hypothetical protein